LITAWRRRQHRQVEQENAPPFDSLDPDAWTAAVTALDEYDIPAGALQRQCQLLVPANRKIARGARVLAIGSQADRLTPSRTGASTGGWAGGACSLNRH
jgi:hypothetical protein